MRRLPAAPAEKRARSGAVQQAGARSGDVAVALGLALGPAVALGLARVAYGLLLPAMRTELGWSFATAGAMNTANAPGYLAGALLAAPLARRLGVRRLFLAAITVTAWHCWPPPAPATSRC